MKHIHCASALLHLDDQLQTASPQSPLLTPSSKDTLKPAHADVLCMTNKGDGSRRWKQTHQHMSPASRTSWAVINNVSRQQNIHNPYTLQGGGLPDPMCKQHLPATATCCTGAKFGPQRYKRRRHSTRYGFSAPRQRCESHSTAPCITIPDCSKLTLTLIVHQAPRVAQHKGPGRISLHATGAIPV
jgi:hypothetical protein